MTTTNITRALAPSHPLDILNLRRIASRVCIGPLSNADIERLWSTYSRDRAAGDGWLPVVEESLEDFSRWLKDGK